MATNVSSIQ